jgi:type 1 glutamine amidotransferase
MHVLSSFVGLVGLHLIASAVTAAEVTPIKALLVVGGCCHDYAKQQTILSEGITARARVSFTIAYDPDKTSKHINPVYEKDDWAASYDVVIHNECSANVVDKTIVDRILAPHRKGLPAVNLHCAMHSYRVKGSTDWFEFTGLTTHSHGKQTSIVLDYVGANHPILEGLSAWTTGNEEQYKGSKVWPTVTTLIKGTQEGKTTDVVAWTNDYRGTKVFSTTLGHNNDTVADARYLDLITRGMLWSVGKLNAEYLKPAK